MRRLFTLLLLILLLPYGSSGHTTAREACTARVIYGPGTSARHPDGKWERRRDHNAGLLWSRIDANHWVTALTSGNADAGSTVPPAFLPPLIAAYYCPVTKGRLNAIQRTVLAHFHPTDAAGLFPHHWFW